MNKKIFVLILVLLVLPFVVSAQQVVFSSARTDHPTRLEKPRVYHLKKKVAYADFNYTVLHNIAVDSLVFDDSSLIKRAFEPVAGNYTFYQFVATYKGFAYEGGIKTFHDILIVKTDENNVIQDAYQYTQEWAEMPLSYDIFRSMAKDVVLKDKLSLLHLNLQRIEEPYDINIERAVVKLKIRN